MYKNFIMKKRKTYIPVLFYKSDSWLERGELLGERHQTEDGLLKELGVLLLRHQPNEEVQVGHCRKEHVKS